MSDNIEQFLVPVEPKTAACKFIESKTMVIPKPGKFPDVDNKPVKSNTAGTDNIEDQKYQKSAKALMKKALEIAPSTRIDGSEYGGVGSGAVHGAIGGVGGALIGGGLGYLAADEDEKAKGMLAGGAAGGLIGGGGGYLHGEQVAAQNRLDAGAKKVILDAREAKERAAREIENALAPEPPVKMSALRVPSLRGIKQAEVALIKQAIPGVTGGLIGAAAGSLMSPEGERARGAGYGAGIGAGTELGAGIGGAAGGLLGGLVTLPIGGIGAIPGMMAGMGLGGYGGYRVSKGIADDYAEDSDSGELPWAGQQDVRDDDATKRYRDKKKKRDGDGDGMVNDGTPEEKEAKYTGLGAMLGGAGGAGLAALLSTIGYHGNNYDTTDAGTAGLGDPLTPQSDRGAGQGTEIQGPGIPYHLLAGAGIGAGLGGAAGRAVDIYQEDDEEKVANTSFLDSINKQQLMGAGMQMATPVAGAGIGALINLIRGKSIGRGAGVGALTGAGMNVGNAAGMLAVGGPAMGAPAPWNMGATTVGGIGGSLGGGLGGYALGQAAFGPEDEEQDGDGDGMVNDGTPEEKEAQILVPSLRGIKQAGSGTNWAGQPKPPRKKLPGHRQLPSRNPVSGPDKHPGGTNWAGQPKPPRKKLPGHRQPDLEKPAAWYDYINPVNYVTPGGPVQASAERTRGNKLDKQIAVNKAKAKKTAPGSVAHVNKQIDKGPLTAGSIRKK